VQLGLGLYRRMLTGENFRFARQAGCTHIVAHLVDYFQEGRLHGTGAGRTWGVTRNRGKVPRYHEVFVDEGDVDMIRALGVLRQNGYDGLLVPDHTPQMTCPAGWHAGMAFALGYMRAAIRKSCATPKHVCVLHEGETESGLIVTLPTGGIAGMRRGWYFPWLWPQRKAEGASSWQPYDQGLPHQFRLAALGAPANTKRSPPPPGEGMARSLRIFGPHGRIGSACNAFDSCYIQRFYPFNELPRAGGDFTGYDGG